MCKEGGWESGEPKGESLSPRNATGGRLAGGQTLKRRGKAPPQGGREPDMIGGFTDRTEKNRGQIECVNWGYGRRKPEFQEEETYGGGEYHGGGKAGTGGGKLRITLQWGGVGEKSR